MEFFTDSASDSDKPGHDTIDLTDVARRRRMRHVGQFGWTLGACLGIGVAFVFVLFGVSRQPVSPVLIAIGIVVSLSGSALAAWLAFRLARPDEGPARLGRRLAPFARVCLVIVGLASLASLQPQALIVAPFCIVLGVMLVPAAASVKDSVGELSRLEPGSDEAAVAQLVFSWRRLQDHFSSDGAVRLSRMVPIGILVALASIGIEFRVPSPWRYIVLGGMTVVIIIVARWYLRSRTLALQEALVGDTRPPVLYLRPFAVDNGVVWRFTLPSAIEYAAFRRTFAEFLGRVIGSAGPVVAIGEPKSPGKTIGVAQQHFADHEWQDNALDLMSRAHAIVIVAGKTSGVKWEIEQLLAGGHLEKTVILLPRNDGPAFIESWAAMCDAFDADGRIEMPEELDPATTVAVLPAHKGRICVLTVRQARSSRNYELAVRAALALVANAPAKTGREDAVLSGVGAS